MTTTKTKASTVKMRSLSHGNQAKEATVTAGWYPWFKVCAVKTGDPVQGTTVGPKQHARSAKLITSFLYDQIVVHPRCLAFRATFS